MPTLSDVGRLDGAPHAGPRRAQVRIGRTRRGRRGPGVWEVFAVGRGAGFVVLAEVTARAASELRLADGGPVRGGVEATNAARPEPLAARGAPDAMAPANSSAAIASTRHVAQAWRVGTPPPDRIRTRDVVQQRRGQDAAIHLGGGHPISSGPR